MTVRPWTGPPRASKGKAVESWEVRFCAQCGAPLRMELVEERQRPRCPACRQVAFLDPKLVVAALVLAARLIPAGRTVFAETGPPASPTVIEGLRWYIVRC